MSSLNHFQFATSVLLTVLIWTANSGLGYPQEVVEPVSDAQRDKTVSLKGLVIASKKYTFQLESNGTVYEVRPDTSAKIALLLNKPFFDWKTGKVGVEVKPKATGSAATKLPRVQFDLPSESLYVIAKFRTPVQLKRWHSSKDKRLNFYLVTPEKLDGHEPTEDELYVSGKIIPDKKKPVVTLETDKKKHRVRLGFRTATMSGFSIGDFKPNQTRVTLTGVVDSNNQVQASSIAFEPVK